MARRLTTTLRARQMVVMKPRAEASGAPWKPHTTGLAVVPVADWWGVRDLGNGWQAAYRFAVQSGYPVVAEMRIFPAVDGEQAGEWPGELLGVASGHLVPPGGLRPAIVSRAKVGADTTEIRTQLFTLVGKRGDDPMRRSAPARRLRQLGLRWIAPPPRDVAPNSPGRPRKSVEHYAAVKRAYADAMRRGSRRPILDAAESLGLEPSIVRRDAQALRRRKLLPPTVQGRPIA